MGHGRCGKSSLIRCLTGVSKASRTRLTLANQSIIDISVWVRSAQEVGRSPQQVLTLLRRTTSNFALMSLRLNPYNRQPNANAYLNLLRNHFQVIVLNLPVAQTANANASVTRRNWGWV